MTDYFHKLEIVPTKNILNNDDIIQLVQEKIHEEDDINNNSKEKLILIFLNKILKSLQTWITFFDQ